MNPVIVDTARATRRLEYDAILPKDADVVQSRRVILDAVKRLPNVLRDPPPEVLPIVFGNDSFTLRLRWWIEPPDQFELQRGLDRVLEQVRRALMPQASVPPSKSRESA